MPAQVNLDIIHGRLTGQSYTYLEYATCIIGRAPDCNIQLPDDEHHRKISRHHCLLEINPPGIRVRDFGSLNGTWVNDQRIGRRERNQTPEEAALEAFPVHDLRHNDKIRLGDTIFQVSVMQPVTCVECGKEIPPDQQSAAMIGGALYQCRECRQKVKPVSPPPAPKRKINCIGCGTSVDIAEVSPSPKAMLCATCRNDPLQMIKILMNLANRGQRELISIKGYSIIRELGRGGMGAVFLAKNEQTGQEEALKVMLPKVATDKRAEQLFLREVELSKVLKHPNLVQLKNSGCSEGTFYFTLEFCRGGSVDQLMLKRGGHLPLGEATRIIMEVLDGLIYAEKVIINVPVAGGQSVRKKGLVHRDLKPANIFLSEPDGKGIAKVADFGLGKAFQAAGLSGMTATGTASGSPWFMPRQQVINFKYAQPEVDVWAAVASYYNMLTGFFPRDFAAGRDPWLIVLQSSPVPIRQRNPRIPDALARLIDEALTDQPEIRFKSAAALKEALSRVVG